MSIVGNRPETLKKISIRDPQAFCAPSGCFSACSVYRKGDNSLETKQEWDNWYAEMYNTRWILPYDLMIMLRAIPVILRGRNE
jgi:lipopolysaccharide/colanic/teichoic acid biosynthesis glycosyltransferase